MPFWAAVSDSYEIWLHKQHHGWHLWADFDANWCKSGSSHIPLRHDLSTPSWCRKSMFHLKVMPCFENLQHGQSHI